ncbi:MAG: hypothetical protein QXR69_00655 [Conexivisphaerales archaeon]
MLNISNENFGIRNKYLSEGHYFKLRVEMVSILRSMKVGGMVGIIAAIALFSLATPVTIHADSNWQKVANDNGKQNSLSLTLTGQIVSAGEQRWYQSASQNDALYAHFNGQQVSISSFHYSLKAKVDGLSAEGMLALTFYGSVDGQTVSVTGGPVVAMIAGECFPSLSTPSNGACQPSDTSAIPVFFVAAGKITYSGSTIPVELIVELGFLNPYKAPLVISTWDGAFVLVSSYDRSQVVWHNVHLAGNLVGSLGSEAVSGSFVQTTNAIENFVTGKENESGSIAFTGMSDSALNGQGRYTGTSIIPTANEIDCSAITGIPGTCTLTGFNSSGSFTIQTEQSTITGKYNVTWSVPAVAFTGSISAMVAEHNGD